MANLNAAGPILQLDVCAWTCSTCGIMQTCRSQCSSSYFKRPHEISQAEFLLSKPPLSGNSSSSLSFLHCARVHRPLSQKTMTDVLKEICEGKPGVLIKNDLSSKLRATSDFSIGSSWSKRAVKTGNCCSYIVRSLQVV